MKSLAQKLTQNFPFVNDAIQVDSAGKLSSSFILIWIPLWSFIVAVINSGL